MKKSQLSTDFMIGFILCVMFLGFFLRNYYSFIITISKDYSEFEKTAKVFLISELLITTTGEPLDWTAENFTIIGLAEYKKNSTVFNSVNLTKFKEFEKTNYSSLFGIKNLCISLKTKTTHYGKCKNIKLVRLVSCTEKNKENACMLMFSW